MAKITPSVILFPLKISGGVMGVPMPIIERKRYTFAVKWVLKAIRAKHRIVTVDSVAETITSAVYGRGLAIEQKEAVNRTASANRYLTRFLRY